MFSIKSRKCQEPPRTDKSQTPTNADLQSTYYSTLSTKLDTPRRTLPTIRGRRCSRRMAHSDMPVLAPPTPQDWSQNGYEQTHMCSNSYTFSASIYNIIFGMPFFPFSDFASISAPSLAPFLIYFPYFSHSFFSEIVLPLQRERDFTFFAFFEYE